MQDEVGAHLESAWREVSIRRILLQESRAISALVKEQEVTGSAAIIVHGRAAELGSLDCRSR